MAQRPDIDIKAPLSEDGRQLIQMPFATVPPDVAHQQSRPSSMAHRKPVHRLSDRFDLRSLTGNRPQSAEQG